MQLLGTVPTDFPLCAHVVTGSSPESPPFASSPAIAHPALAAATAERACRSGATKRRCQIMLDLTSRTLRSVEVGNLELKGDLTGTFAFPEVVSRREGERPRGTSSERSGCGNRVNRAALKSKLLSVYEPHRAP